MMVVSKELREDPFYERAIEIHKHKATGNIDIAYCVKFIREWKHITNKLKGAYACNSTSKNVLRNTGSIWNN